MIGNDSHSFKLVGEFLARDTTDLSSETEKACFKAACVIFIMGHLIMLSSKYDYMTVDYWGALL